MSENVSTESTSNPIESSPQVQAEIGNMDEAVHDTAEINMSGSSDEGTEEVSEGSEEPATSQASDKDTAKAADKLNAKEVKGSDGELFKIKVDGEEIQLKRDEMVRLAQMGKAGQRAMQEKAELQKSITAFIEALKSDPGTVLKEDLGMDVNKFAQELLARQLEEESMDPKEKELRELKAQLERINKEKEEEKKRMEREQFEAEVARYEQELETQVQEAFEANKLPRSPIFLMRMADLLEEAQNRNLNVSPKQIASIIKEDWLNQTKSALGSFDDDQLESILGSEIVSRLRKQSLKKAKSVPSLNTAKASIESVKTPEKVNKSEKIAWKDFLKKNISE